MSGTDQDKNLNLLKSRFYHGDTYVQGEFIPNFSQQKLINYSTTSGHTAPQTSVFFDGIEAEIEAQIEAHEIAVGAVAWLTNKTILNALSKKVHTSIVIQKEDFLRRDSNTTLSSNWKQYLKNSYSKLPEFSCSDFHETYPGQQEEHPHYNAAVQHWLFDASGVYQLGGSAIRCLGYSDTAGKVIPRMHHKFLVLGDRCEGLVMRPKVVLTGSFNMTHNATKSRENLLVLRDSQLCHAYLSEWAQLWSMSEQLDWTSPEPTIPTLNMST